LPSNFTIGDKCNEEQLNPYYVFVSLCLPCELNAPGFSEFRFIFVNITAKNKVFRYWRGINVTRLEISFSFGFAVDVVDVLIRTRDAL